MNLKLSKLLILLGLCAGIDSCVYINEELGSNFIPMDQRYDIQMDTLVLSGMTMEASDKLSGYSSSRITVGAIMDADNNISKRSSAFSVIPADKYDFGEGGYVSRFHFAAAKDTLSYIDNGQRTIIQNIYVHSLKDKIKEDQLYIGSNLEKDRLIAKTVYDGSDSLSFDFDNTWATEDFLRRLQSMETSAYDSIGAFTEKIFPGIIISSDNPVSEGGRINMFTLAIGADLQNYTLSGGYATLHIKDAEFDGVKVADTTFMFMYGATDFSITQEATDYYSGETLTPQYALNLSSSEGGSAPSPQDMIIIEGAGGLKPVISAEKLKDSFIDRLEEKGISPSDVVVNKATLVLPLKESLIDYQKMHTYPTVISASCRLESKDGKKLISYAGITDTSSSSEDPGELNRSTNTYTPDISYHLQRILSTEDSEDLKEKDIWFLTMAKETQQQEQEGTSEYYKNLQYSAYYNNLYNYGGYGGYGGYYGGYGYGGYGGYGYNNVYDYYTMAALYSMQGQQTQQVESKIELDRDRYYKAVLAGIKDPESISPETDLIKERIPALVVTYSVRKRQ